MIWIQMWNRIHGVLENPPAASQRTEVHRHISHSAYIRLATFLEIFAKSIGIYPVEIRRKSKDFTSFSRWRTSKMEFREVFVVRSLLWWFPKLFFRVLSWILIRKRVINTSWTILSLYLFMPSAYIRFLEISKILQKGSAYIRGYMPIPHCTPAGQGWPSGLLCGRRLTNLT